MKAIMLPLAMVWLAILNNYANGAEITAELEYSNSVTTLAQFDRRCATETFLTREVSPECIKGLRYSPRVEKYLDLKAGFTYAKLRRLYQISDFGVASR